MSVYFISARELDLIKIGYAFNPVARYRHLQTSSPVELCLEGAIPGDFERERQLHRKFALARVRGEWFKLTPALQAQIDKSTKPEKFTWAAVRLWIHKLEQADEALERKKTPPEVVAMVEGRIQEELARAASRRRVPELERREARGDIHFPFRQLEIETS